MKSAKEITDLIWSTLDSAGVPFEAVEVLKFEPGSTDVILERSGFEKLARHLGIEPEHDAAMEDICKTGSWYGLAFGDIDFATKVAKGSWQCLGLLSAAS